MSKNKSHNSNRNLKYYLRSTKVKKSIIPNSESDSDNDSFASCSLFVDKIIPSVNITLPASIHPPRTEFHLSNDSLDSIDSDFFSPKDRTMVNNEEAEAAAASAIQVVNCLKIPDAIKDLPKFDGNPKLLYEFINNVEEILSLTSSVEGTAYSKILLRAIRNKVEGPANEVLNMYGTPLEWDQIKNNLILHYSDKRNETSLIRDLHNLRQHNSTVEKYYSEIIELQATMLNHIRLHEMDSNVIKAKADLFSEMCLNTFLTGLKEPLGSTVRAMRPDSLPIAFSFCIKEQNISYAKTTSYQITKPKPSFRPTNYYQTPPFRNYPNTTYHNNQQQKRFTPYGQQQKNFTPIYPNRGFPPGRQYTPFNQQPRSYTPNPFNRPNTFKPEPMDTGSSNHQFQRTQFSQQQQQPKNQQRELFNVNENEFPCSSRPNIPGHTNDSYYSNLDRFYRYERAEPQMTETEHPDLDDTNFRISGPINQSDT